MRQIFNEVLNQRECTPEAWRRITIKVIYKKGDVEGAGNYRPICTPPALYKLFSTLLYNRLYSRLDRGQPHDQGGVRRSFQTLDHLATYKIVRTEMSRVVNQNVGSDSGLQEKYRKRRTETSTLIRRRFSAIKDQTEEKR